MPRLTQLDRFWQIHRIGRTNRNLIPQRTPERSGEQYQSDKTKVYPRAGGGTGADCQLLAGIVNAVGRAG